jgi:hypothetical protein
LKLLPFLNFDDWGEMSILMMFCWLGIDYLFGSLNNRWKSLQFFANFLFGFVVVFKNGEGNFLFQNFQQIIAISEIVNIIIPAS